MGIHMEQISVCVCSFKEKKKPSVFLWRSVNQFCVFKPIYNWLSIEKTFYIFEIIFQVVRHEDNLKMEGQFEGRKQAGQVIEDLCFAKFFESHIS